MDITPKGLGISVLGGFMSTIIKKGTHLPIRVKKDDYCNAFDDQTEACIVIYEGEEKMAKDNHELGSFTLSGMPKSKAKENKIKI